MNLFSDPNQIDPNTGYPPQQQQHQQQQQQQQQQHDQGYPPQQQQDQGDCFHLLTKI